MKLNRPNSISICFIGGDLSITKSQENNLIDLADKYMVEFLHRGDKFTRNYHSFSQIINEFVVESENEFMIFINPKINPRVEHVEDLIDKLCSGYCWVSRVSFGFWATTKELFRNVGLMDERFIGSEYEDNDFMIRLKIFSKAIFWEYKLDEYPYNFRFPFSSMRGLSKDIFLYKWGDSRNDFYLNRMIEEKKLPKKIRLKRNYEIFNSWLDKDETKLIHSEVMPGMSECYNKDIKLNKSDINLSYSMGVIKFSGDMKHNKVEFLCDISTHITVVMINLKSQNICTENRTIYSNTWFFNNFFDDTEDYIEIKIFHGADKIYHNKYVNIPFNFDVEIGLRIVSYLD
jgi:hypothetical protein